MAVHARAGSEGPSTTRPLTRQDLEAAIEQAIAVLDAWDGDTELEDGGDWESDVSDWEMPAPVHTGPTDQSGGRWTRGSL